MFAERSAPSRIHVVVMSRAPIAGQAKTRLTPPMSPEEARDFHAACVSDVLDCAVDWSASVEARGIPVQIYLFITPPDSQAAFAETGVRIPPDALVRPQSGENLWRRMEHALNSALEDAPPDTWAILVGSDLPMLAPVHLKEAVAALERADVVYGPALDGGYYLIGVRRRLSGLFDLQDVNGESVLEKSLRAARGRGHHTAIISALPDADTIEDLRRIRAHLDLDQAGPRRGLKFISDWFDRNGMAAS
jgi:rSAM/selenodomain-associated transferase 1